MLATRNGVDVIYFCIPAHNEERTAGLLLWKIRQVMEAFPRDYQILVLDDASDDRTAEVLEPYVRVLPLTVLRNDERQGYAASLERLLGEAVDRSSYPKRDVAVTVQADFTDEPDRIPDLLKKVEGGADVVSGAPRLGGGAVPRRVRWMRWIAGLLLRGRDWPEPVTDPSHGFRAYRLICVKKAMQIRNGRLLLSSEGWAANAELLRVVSPYCRRFEEAEVAVRYDRRLRESRLRFWSTASQLLRLARAGDNAVATEAEPGGTVPEAEGGGAGRGHGRDGQSSRRGGAGGERRRGGRGRGSRNGRGRRGPGGGTSGRGDTPQAERTTHTDGEHQRAAAGGNN